LEYNISLIYLGEYIDNYNLLLILNDTQHSKLNESYGSNKNVVYLGRVNHKKNKNYNSNEELLNSLCRNENVEFVYDESEFELINKNENIHLQFENVSYNKTFNINLDNTDNLLDLFLSKLNYSYCLLERKEKLVVEINNIKLVFNLELELNKQFLEAKIKNNISLNNNKIRELSNLLRNLKSENNLLEENLKYLIL
jgi:hypothetical protein